MRQETAFGSVSLVSFCQEIWLRFVSLFRIFPLFFITFLREADEDFLKK